MGRRFHKLIVRNVERKVTKMPIKKREKKRIQLVLEIPPKIIKIIETEIEGKKFGFGWTSIINQIVCLWLNDQSIKEQPDKSIFMKDLPAGIILELKMGDDLKKKIREYNKQGCKEIRPRLPAQLMEYVNYVCNTTTDIKSNSAIIRTIVYIWLDSKGYIPDIKEN